MTTHDIPTPQTTLKSDRIRHAMDAFFATVGQGFNAYLTARARTDEVERLYSKSDKELARMGLTREDIPRYVFRDIINF